MQRQGSSSARGGGPLGAPSAPVPQGARPNSARPTAPVVSPPRPGAKQPLLAPGAMRSDVEVGPPRNGAAPKQQLAASAGGGDGGGGRSMANYVPPAGSSSAQSQNVTSTSAWCRSFLTVLLAVAFGYWFRAVQAGAECGSVEGGGVAGSGAVANLLSWSLTPTPGMAPCGDGLFLAGPTPSPFNIGLYMALLLWCFVGVAIGADVFMVKPSRGASNVHPCTCIRVHPLTCMARARVARVAGTFRTPSTRSTSG